MNELLSFLKVAQSNVKRIEKEIISKNYDHAIITLKSLIEVLEKTENSVNFCPSLTQLKKYSLELLKRAEDESHQEDSV